MKEYWGHAFAEEGAGYASTATETTFRSDMHECPSQGFLLRNQLEQHHDYCDHCIGWIGPLLKRAGFTIDHQHNHCGQCWWEMRSISDAAPPSPPGELARDNDVRLRPDWKHGEPSLDTFLRANHPDEKTRGLGS